MVFYLSLSENNFLKSLLRILVILNNAVVWMITSRHLISKSPSTCTNLSVTVLSKVQLVLPLLSYSIVTAKFTILRFLCLVDNHIIVKPRLGNQFVCCVSFSRTAEGLCMYYLFIWSNFNFLHNSQWITLPTQSCLVLYSFCANLLHLFIVWLIVLSISLHNLNLLYWYIWFL